MFEAPEGKDGSKRLTGRKKTHGHHRGLHGRRLSHSGHSHSSSLSESVDADSYRHEVVNKQYGMHLYSDSDSWYDEAGMFVTYEITDVDNTTEYYVGQLCPGGGGPACRLRLPPGEYVWRVSGANDSDHDGGVKWTTAGSLVGPVRACCSR